MHPERDPADHIGGRLRAHLHDEAGAVRPLDATAPQVITAGRRRRRNRRAVTALGAVAAMVATAGIIGSVIGDSSDGGFAVDGGTTISEPPAVTTVPEAAVPMTTVGPDTGEGIDDGIPVSTAVPAVAGSLAGPSHVVWWSDRFLSLDVTHGRQQIQPMSDELLDLFPDEVRDLFDEQPTTVDEALVILNQHPELLAEVDRVLTEHPAAFDAVYGTPSTAELRMETSLDGRTWEPLPPTAMPPGMTSAAAFATHGERLVMVGDGPMRPDGTSSGIVASTVDLVTWDTVQSVELPAADTDVAGVTTSHWFTGVDIGPSGVIVSAMQSVNFDTHSLLPDDLFEPDRHTGIGVTTNDVGVEVLLHGEAPDGAEVVVDRYEFTWEELGFAPELAASLVRGNARWMLLTGPLDGDLRLVDPFEAASGVPASALYGDSSVVALSAGGFAVSGGDGDTGAWRVAVSDDGIAWSERGPDGDGMGSLTLAEVADVLVLVASDVAGPRAFVSADRGLSWEPVDLPGGSDQHTIWNGLVGGEHGAVMWAVLVPGAGLDADPGVERPDEVVVTRDDYRLVIGNRVPAEPPEDIVMTLERTGDDGTPDLVLTWSVDQMTGELPEHLVEQSDGSYLIVDPDTGEELVTFTPADFDAAYAEAFPDLHDETGAMAAMADPRTVVMRTADGRAWHVIDEIDASVVDVAVGAGGALLSTFDDRGGLETRVIEW